MGFAEQSITRYLCLTWNRFCPALTVSIGFVLRPCEVVYAKVLDVVLDVIFYMQSLLRLNAFICFCHLPGCICFRCAITVV